MKDIFGVLKEPSNLIKSRYATLLASSMHGYLLCECCLQPQTGLGVKIVDAQPDGLTRQNSASGQRGLLRQGSVFSRQTSLQFNRQNSGLTRLGSHLSRQGSASLGRQNSHLGTADISLWPVKIRSPCDQIIPFLPLAMISLNAALAVNGPPNLGRLFGLPSHIIPDDMLPFVMDFIAAFDAPETSKDFQILQDKVRMVSSKDSPPLNFCIEQFGLFLMREDPQSTWKSFLSRR